MELSSLFFALIDIHVVIVIWNFVVRKSHFRIAEISKFSVSESQNAKSSKFDISDSRFSDNRGFFCTRVLLSCVYKSRRVFSVVQSTTGARLLKTTLLPYNKDCYHWRIPRLLFSLTKRYVQHLVSFNPQSYYTISNEG